MGAPPRGSPGLLSDPPGHADEPPCNRPRRSGRLRAGREDEKGGLERIVGRGWPDQPSTQPVNDRPVPPHEFCERVFIPAVDEARQQFDIRGRGRGPNRKAVQERKQGSALIQLNFGFRYAFSQANSWFSLLPAKVLADAEAAFGSYGNRSHSHLSTSAVSWANWNAAGCRV